MDERPTFGIGLALFIPLGGHPGSDTVDIAIEKPGLHAISGAEPPSASATAGAGTRRWLGSERLNTSILRH
jgi:hypothetical protein